MSTVASEIRLAREQDAFALASVHETAWRGAYSGLIPHRCLNAMIGRRHENWWVRAIRAGAAILVVEFGGETVGYATVGRNRSGTMKAEGEIYELYFKPQYQGVSFGGRLFAAARALLGDRNLSGLVVWAIAENHQAVDFYTRRGGRIVADGQETFEGLQMRKLAFYWP